MSGELMASTTKLTFMRAVNSISLPPLRKWQERTDPLIRAAIREGHRRIVVQSPTGAGKCHGRGTQVIMYDGTLRNVEDLEPGDLLMGPDSKPRMILGTTVGWGDLFEVVPHKGEPFVCNDVHVLSLKRTNTKKTNHRSGKTMKRSRSDCKDGAIVNIPLNDFLSASKTFRHIHKLWRAPVEFTEGFAYLPIDPYAMGVLLGDGSMNHSPAVTTMDPEIVEAVQELANFFGLRVHQKEQPGNRSSVYSIYGKKGSKNPLKEALRSLGLGDSVCGDKFIPLKYKTAHRLQRLRLLAGLMDTDGHISADSRYAEFSVKSPRLIEDFAFLCRSLGFACSVAKKIVSGTTYYRAHLSGDFSVIPMRIARKKPSRARRQKKDVLVAGFSVRYLGKGYYYGFSLGGDHLYLLRDFTVTHNTLLSAHLFAGAVNKGKRPMFVVPDLSLIKQTIKSFERVGINDIGVIQGRHERTDWEAQVQIASVQTLVRRVLPEVDLVVIDECFPAGTMVTTSRGDKPIEKIAPGDLVANAIGTGRVLSLFKSSHIKFVRVRLSNGSSFRCTPDHPIFTASGWKKAGELEVREELFRQEDLCLLRQAIRPQIYPKRSKRGFPGSGESIQRAHMLQHILLEEAQEPYASTRESRESVRKLEAHWAPADGKGGERKANARIANSDISDPGRRVEDGVRRENSSASTDLSALLQAGLGKPHGEDRGGAGWWQSLLSYSQGARPEKGCSSSLPRVESIEIEELTRAEPVYNLRVSGHPSYFANGILVHNCHAQYKGLYKILDSPAWKDKIVIGLSATPWARGMGHHWTRLIIGATIKELIAEGVLCGFQGYGPRVDPDMSKVHITAGEFVDSESSAVMRDKKIVADVVEQWIEKGAMHGVHDRTFMFCVDRAHAREQQAKFIEAGIPWGYIDGTMDPETEREPVFEAYRRREIKGIASVGCLSRGIDEDVRCIIDAQPDNSEIRYVQKTGRGLRMPAEDSDKVLLYLDHAGNAARLGLVTDIHHEELDNRKPGDKEKTFPKDTVSKPHKCGKCNAIVPFGMGKCPLCGFTARKESHTKHAQGELTQFSSNSTKEKKATRQEQERWYGMFLGLAVEKGHSPGWAAYRFKERFKEWPRGMNETPITPNQEVRSYNTHLNIKYKFSRQKKGS